MKRLLAASLAILCALVHAPALAGSAGNFPINLDTAPSTYMTPHGLIVSDDLQGAKSLTDLGTTSKVLIGNATGDPTWGAVPAGAFGPLTGDVTSVGYATTLAKISGVPASRVVAVDGSNVPTGSFLSSVLANSLTDETGSSSGGVAVFNNGPTLLGTTNVASLTASGVIKSTLAQGGFQLDGAAGTVRSLYAKTGGVIRWQIQFADSGAETGSNAGSGLRFVSYDDTGVALGTPFILSRLGVLTLSPALGVSSGGTGDTTLASNALLYGNGTGAVQALAPNSGATRKFVVDVSSGTPAYDVLLNSDLPLATTSTKGAIIPSLCVGHFFSVGIDPGTASPSCAQPAFGDLTGTLASSQFGPLTGDVTTSGYAATLTNSSTARANLGVGIGTNVEAWSTPLDQLAALGNVGIIKRSSSTYQGAVANTDYLPVALPVWTGVAKGGGVTSNNNVGSLASSVDTVNAAAGTVRTFGVQSATVQRWTWGGDSSTETGTGNAGTDFNICRMLDAGTLNDCPFKLSRSTGAATFADGIASPSLTGTPTAPTAAGGTNTTQIATTQFVQSAIGGVSFPVTSVFSRTGAVTAQSGDYSFSLISGQLNLATQVTGTIPAANLPLAATSTRGAIIPALCVGNFFSIGIDPGTASTSCQQPAFSGISGSLNLATQVTGTIPNANLPLAGTATRGAIIPSLCVGHFFSVGIDPGTASPSCAQPAFGDLASTPTTVAGYGITDALKTTNNLSDLSSYLSAQNNLKHYPLTLTTQFDKTTNTPTQVSALAITPVSGENWNFDLQLFITGDATGGIKIRMGTGGALTVSSAAYHLRAVCLATGAVLADVRQSDITTNLNYSAGCTGIDVTIRGAAQFNGSGGTFGPMFAEMSSTGTSSVLVNSHGYYQKTN